MQQIHRRKPMPKCDFNNFTEIALQHGCSPVHLLHIFRTPFPRNTSGWLLLTVHDDLDSYPLFLPFHLKLSHHFLVPKFVFFFFYIFFVLLKFLLNELNKFVNLCLILCRLPFSPNFTDSITEYRQNMEIIFILQEYPYHFCLVVHLSCRLLPLFFRRLHLICHINHILRLKVVFSGGRGAKWSIWLLPPSYFKKN